MLSLLLLRRAVLCVVCCVVCCAVMCCVRLRCRLKSAGVSLYKLRQRLCRAVEANLGLMQLTTVSKPKSNQSKAKKQRNNALPYPHVPACLPACLPACTDTCISTVCCALCSLCVHEWYVHTQVCYCWNDISSLLAADLQTVQHPDVAILDQLQVTRPSMPSTVAILAPPSI